MTDHICVIDRCRKNHDRFWRKVNKDGPLPLWAPFLGPCWMWTGKLNDKGYGYIHVNNRQERAHRYSYTLLVGEPPMRPLCLDHVCRVRACVRPDHLEIVTLGENVLRGVGRTAIHKRQTHCKRGHPFSGDNLRVTARGWRDCRTCNRERMRERYRAQRIKGLAS